MASGPALIRAPGGHVPFSVDSATLQPASPPQFGPRLTLDRWFAEQGTPPEFDLARSGARSLTVAELLEVTSTPLHELLDVSLDYGAGRGSPRLVRAVRRSLGASETAAVVVAGGAVEALLLLCLATERRGHVLVGTPAYGALRSAPAAAGRDVRVASVWDPVRGLHFDQLAGMVTTSTALVVVNSPHNPSGASASLRDIDELARQCAHHGALLVVDEVARGTLDPRVRSAANTHGFADGRIAILGDVSKSLGLGGLRIGWLATVDPALAGRAAVAKDATTVSSATVSEWIAAVALESSDILLRPVAEAARANLSTLAAVVTDNGDSAGWVPPVDGLVAFPRLNTTHGIDSLVARLLAVGVGVVPGRLFEEPDRIRVGLGGEPHLFEEAMRRLRCELGA